MCEHTGGDISFELIIHVRVLQVPLNSWVCFLESFLQMDYVHTIENPRNPGALSGECHLSGSRPLWKYVPIKVKKEKLQNKNCVWSVKVPCYSFNRPFFLSLFFALVSFLSDMNASNKRTPSAYFLLHCYWSSVSQSLWWASTFIITVIIYFESRCKWSIA